MSMLSLGIKLLFRGSKLLSETVAEKAGVGDVAKLSIPFKTKIADLATDKGLSLDYVNGLVAQAKDEKSLKAIESYLTSNRNHLNWNTTDALLKKVEEKLGDAAWEKHLLAMKQEFLANHADKMAAVIEQVREMI